MTAQDERPASVPWPPILYLGAVAAAFILHLFFPVGWLGSPAADILFAIGLLTIAGGLAMDVMAMRRLARERTTIMPHKASTHLVTDGIYAVTRNPIYLGNTMLMIGLGLAAGMVWLLLLAPVAAFATQQMAILPEERHLAARFGKRYRDYQKRVRRWI